MEALVAISLAGNVIQFTQTASAVVRLVRDLYSSTTGSCGDVEGIEETYTTLRKAHARLKATGAATDGPGRRAAIGDEEELIRLAARCEVKCSQLVKLAGKLNVHHHGRLRGISVIRVVALTFTSEPELKKLEKEINDIQTAMVLIVCLLTRYRQTTMSFAVLRLT
jgi:hypothetical protein